MRVLHVISSIDPRHGGPAVALEGLAKAQQQAGLDVSVISTFQPDADFSIAQRLNALGIKVETIGPASARLSRHPNLSAKTDAMVAASNIVHIHALWEEIQHRAARLAARRSVPYLIRPCGMLDPWSLSQSRLKKRIYLALRLRRNLNRACALHFTTRTEAELTQPLKLKAPSLVEPNGLDLAEFDSLPSPDEFRRRWPQVGTRPIVLFMSRLHPKKGLELLIPAFALSGESESMLVIAGPDSEGYQAKLQALAAREKIENRVVFTGMLRGVDRLAAYAAAQLFVLPSYQENFGNVVIEALAAGAPVIISDQVNIHQEITAAGVGSVVPTQIKPLADALGRWLKDPMLRQETSNRAKPWVRQHYNWLTIAQRWKMHYARLTGASSA